MGEERSRKEVIDMTLFREMICSAHMAGQADAGSNHPSWYNACCYFAEITEKSLKYTRLLERMKHEEEKK